MINRRTFLRTGMTAAGAGGLGLLAGCGEETPPDRFVAPDGARVRAAEKARNGGRTVSVRLTPEHGEVDLGGTTVNTYSYAGRVPGRELRVTAGEVLEAVVDNKLPDKHAVHWHGLALRNDADGVPEVTQRPIGEGDRYTYRFATSYPGTYWFHSHVGVQRDRGLYGPLIIEDPREPLSYDDEWVVVLDDWLDGVTGTPDQVLAELSKGMGHMGHGKGDDGGAGSPSPGGGHGSASPSHGGMGDGMDGSMSPGGGHHGSHSSPSPSHGDGMGDGMDGGMGHDGGHMMMAKSKLLGGDAGDVKYPHFLINGRLPTAPESYRGKPGTKVRIRIINASADTAFRVALGEHTLTVTHTDGFPVEPFDTDAVLISQAERYDVVVTLADGVFPLVALAEGKKASALALVRTGGGRAPKASVRPKELDGKLVSYDDLRPTDDVRLDHKKPDRVVKLKLTGGMKRYNWGVQAKQYDPKRIMPIAEGERVRFELHNMTTMFHPWHLHGHTFALAGSDIRKDTVIVLPKRKVVTYFDADNPGIWITHCHNAYHMASGMAALLGYLDK